MNITTNQNTLRPNVPGFFTLVLSQPGFDDIEADINTKGDVVRSNVGPVTVSLLHHHTSGVVTEILADIRAGFMWLDALERRTGKHIAECTGSLPCGRWVVIDIGGRCLHLLESPRDESVELPLAVECGV